MLRNIQGLRRLRPGTVVGVFMSDDPGLIPLQVAIKSGEDKWSFVGMQVPWTSEELFYTAQSEKVVLQLMRRI